MESMSSDPSGPPSDGPATENATNRVIIAGSKLNTTTTTTSSATANTAADSNTINSSSTSDQLDNLSNLLINGSWEDEVLDQYENETEKTINEHLQVERDQSTQKLFQSFQTSACAVAQMFKDKTQPPLTPWQSFQNSAGAITVLYKGNLLSLLIYAR